MSSPGPPDGTVPAAGALSALLKDLAGQPVDAPSVSPAPAAGARIADRFEVVREIGRGGFGAVVEARDLVLKRPVALKFFRPGQRLEAMGSSVVAEADAIARLSHPNIVQIHDRGTSDAGPFLVLELLEGEPLSRRIQRGPLDAAAAARMTLGVARGLAHAHVRGVVHRDLKPANVFLCADGQVKILDFGLAHLIGQVASFEGGTPGWMAPEQRRGEPGDERTDVWAMGALLFRALSGKDPASARLEVPGARDLEALVEAMLEPDPAARPRDASHVVEALEPVVRRLEARPDAPRAPPAASPAPLAKAPGPAPPPAAARPSRAGRLFLSRKRAALLAAGLAVVFAAGTWLVRRETRIRWALEEGLPQVAELVEQSQYPAAVALAEQVEQVIPGNPKLARLWPEMSRVHDVETLPAGADLWVKPYTAPETEWRRVGRSPAQGVRLPLTAHIWRIEMPGFVTLEMVPRLIGPSGPIAGPLRFALDAEGAIPPDMVHVPGGSFSLEIPGLDHLPPMRVGDFVVDRTEVTNDAFKQFVDAGGYRKPEYWKQPFVKDGRSLSFDQAMALFRDRTGRPGPATWESGDCPDGQGALPVTGVSWYEAAAYAAFAGKSLPNLYQWSLAAGTWASSLIVPRSNFGGKSLAPAGSFAGVGPYGTRDMAGNAKEWCWNASGDRRYVLGGAWSEPSYMFNDGDAQSPFARSTTYGFRLVRPLDGETDPAASAPTAWASRDYRQERPVSAEVFRTFRRLYAYDPAPLETKVEATSDEDDWRKETVTFAAAYGGERVMAYLFTPRRATPPYQVVVYFPGSNAIFQRSSEQLPLMRTVSPVVKSGRALLFPVYKSTFERGDGLQSAKAGPTAFYRDHVVMWAKDLGRSLDYVASRRDLDAGRIALYGLSWGARLAPLFAAVDDRIKVGVLVGGGLTLQQCMPEVDPFHFAPHVRQPMLMVNGRYDFTFPYDASQLPLFQVLGTSPADKRHVVVEAGHVPPNDLLTKEVLDWLDRYLGPVR